MLVKLGDLNPNPSNPRTIKDAQFRALKRSIAQFPLMLTKRPIAVFKDGGKWVVIGGNQRYKSLCDLKQEIGESESFKLDYGVSDTELTTLQAFFSNGIPCVDCTDLSEQEQRRFIIADNLPFGEWDTDALANEWDADELKEWGLDLPNFNVSNIDYSDKNKEIDVDDFSDLMELKFKFEQEIYNEVKIKLLTLGETIESGLLNLLENVKA